MFDVASLMAVGDFERKLSAMPSYLRACWWSPRRGRGVGTLGTVSPCTPLNSIMQYWFPDTPGVLWSALFLGLMFALNAISVRGFGEAEYWCALIKVVTVIAFIVIGTLMIFGIMRGDFELHLRICQFGLRDDLILDRARAT